MSKKKTPDRPKSPKWAQFILWPAEERELIESAAKLEQRPMTQFVRRAALAAAEAATGKKRPESA